MEESYDRGPCEKAVLGGDGASSIRRLNNLRPVHVYQDGVQRKATTRSQACSSSLLSGTRVSTFCTRSLDSEDKVTYSAHQDWKATKVIQNSQYCFGKCTRSIIRKPIDHCLYSTTVMHSSSFYYVQPSIRLIFQRPDRWWRDRQYLNTRGVSQIEECCTRCLTQDSEKNRNGTNFCLTAQLVLSPRP